MPFTFCFQYERVKFSPPKKRRYFKMLRTAADFDPTFHEADAKRRRGDTVRRKMRALIFLKQNFCAFTPPTINEFLISALLLDLRFKIFHAHSLPAGRDSRVMRALRNTADTDVGLRRDTHRGEFLLYWRHICMGIYFIPLKPRYIHLYQCACPAMPRYGLPVHAFELSPADRAR